MRYYRPDKRFSGGHYWRNLTEAKLGAGLLASPHQKNLLIYSNFLLKYHISFASKVITLCATVAVGPSQYIMFMFALLVVEDRM
jgi:hypothetical protein